MNIYIYIHDRTRHAGSPYVQDHEGIFSYVCMLFVSICCTTRLDIYAQLSCKTAQAVRVCTYDRPCSSQMLSLLTHVFEYLLLGVPSIQNVDCTPGPAGPAVGTQATDRCSKLRNIGSASDSQTLSFQSFRSGAVATMKEFGGCPDSGERQCLQDLAQQ